VARVFGKVAHVHVKRRYDAILCVLVVCFTKNGENQQKQAIFGANITIFDRKFSTGHFSIFKGKFSTPIFSTENFRHILKLTKENFRQIFDRWVVESFWRNSSRCIKSAKEFFQHYLLGSRKIFYSLKISNMALLQYVLLRGGSFCNITTFLCIALLGNFSIISYST